MRAHQVFLAVCLVVGSADKGSFASECPMLLFSVLSSGLQADLVEDGLFGNHAGHSAGVGPMRQPLSRRKSHPRAGDKVPSFSREGFLLPPGLFESALRYWRESSWGREVAQIEGASITLHEGHPMVVASLSRLASHLESNGRLPILTRLRLPSRGNSAGTGSVPKLKEAFRQLKHVELPADSPGLAALLELLPPSLESLRLGFRPDGGSQTLVARALRSRLVGVRHLEMDFFPSGEVLEALPKELLSLDIQGHGALVLSRDLRLLAATLERLRHLRLLRIDKVSGAANPLDRAFLDSVPRGLLVFSARGNVFASEIDLATRLPALERLDLSEARAEVPYGGVWDVATVVSLPASLTHLAMTDVANAAPGATDQEFTRALRELKSLVSLNLARLTLRGDSRLLEELPRGLVSLDLSALSVHDRAIGLRLEESLRRLESLRDLSVSDWRETHRIPVTFFQFLPRGMRALRVHGLLSARNFLEQRVHVASFVDNLPRLERLEYLGLTDGDLLAAECDAQIYRTPPSSSLEIHYRESSGRMAPRLPGNLLRPRLLLESPLVRSWSYD